MRAEKTKIEYSKRFVKDLKKAPKKVRVAFRSRLEIFLFDKFHPILNNHLLSGGYQGCRSINITGDWRAVFKELNNQQIAHFIALGTHNKLYR